MTPIERTNDAVPAVMDCQQLFWRALQSKDAILFTRVLADEFICHSLNQAPQSRANFIATITSMPMTVASVTAEQVTVLVFDHMAVLTGLQVAELHLPDGSAVQQRLALTNIFRRTAEGWQMVVAHPVTLLDEAST
jgi:ketosteroid isomerase-like protein